MSQVTFCKEYPVLFPGSFSDQKQLIADLKLFLHSLNKADQKACKRQFLQLPQEVRDFIDRVFWIAQGCESAPGYSEWQLRGQSGDFKRLLGVSAPWLLAGLGMDALKARDQNVIEQLILLLDKFEIPLHKMLEDLQLTTNKAELDQNIHNLATLRFQGTRTEYNHLVTSGNKGFGREIYHRKQLKEIANTFQIRIKPTTSQPIVECSSPPVTQGVNSELHNIFGSHVDFQNRQVTFRVYAPHIHALFLQPTYNGEPTQTLRMDRNEEGVWFLKLPFSEKICPGATYRYLVQDKEGGEKVQKSDPFGKQYQRVLKNGYLCCHDTVIVAPQAKVSRFSSDFGVPRCWKVHLPSVFGPKESYRTLAPKIVKFCKENRFNRVELMGLAGHPQDASWGFQATDFFAPNARLGSLEEFDQFISDLHAAKIAVYVDSPVAHLAVDSFGLGGWGSPSLYQHPYRKFDDWGTFPFNYASPFARSFLASYFCYWKERGIDGFRWDAAKTMMVGDVLDKAAANTIRAVTTEVHRRYPNAIIEGEMPGWRANENERSIEPTIPTSQKSRIEDPNREGKRGLGFDRVEGIGLQNTLLRVVLHPDGEFGSSQDDAARQRVCDYLKCWDNSFPYGIEAGQRFISLFSHDECAQGKTGSGEWKTLGYWTQNGERWERFAAWRLILGSIYLIPGSEGFMLFQGTTFGQSQEWSYLRGEEPARSSTQWEELEGKVSGDAAQDHLALLRLTRALNGFHVDHADYHLGTSQCIKRDDYTNQTTAHLVTTPSNQQFISVTNLSRNTIDNYRIEIPKGAKDQLGAGDLLKVAINTDEYKRAGEFAVTNREKEIRVQRDKQGLFFEMNLPSRSIVIFQAANAGR